MLFFLLPGFLLPNISAGEDQPALPSAPAVSDQAGASSSHDAISPAELIWPSPPEKARIRYLGSISKPEDIGRKKGFWRKAWEFLRGEEEDEKVARPMAVAVDSQDRVIIADSARARIHIFDRNTGEYSFIDGTGQTRLSLPVGLAVDSADRIYVADGSLGKILVFKPDGTFETDLGSGSWLKRPVGIAIDKVQKRLYVADAPNHEIKVLDIATGTVLKSLGRQGESPGEFNYPSYLSMGRDGRLLVTDALNARVQIFDADGKFERTFGKKGNGHGDLSAPKGVAVDSEGHIYVVDAEFDNMQIFNENGQLLLIVGTTGEEAGKFWLPTGMYIDHKNRIYVADSHNARVQIFQYLGNSVKNNN